MTEQTASKQRIVFLDVDGPLINQPLYYIDSMCSMQRSVMNTQAIGYVSRLCRFTGAKVVFNTMHNTWDIEDKLTGTKRNIKDDVIRHGLKEEYVFDHATLWKTKFSETTRNRLVAIHMWADEYAALPDAKEFEWVCFDDEHFTDLKSLILIDFEKGIDFQAYRQAMKRFGFRQEPASIFV